MPILIASRVQNKIRKYLAKSESELQVRANVGVVLCGEEYHSIDAILHDAEQALELAKSDRRKMLQILRAKTMESGKDIKTLHILHESFNIQYQERRPAP